MRNGHKEFPGTISVAEASSKVESAFLAKVFIWVAAGLGLTALACLLVAGPPNLVRLIFGNQLLIFGLIIG